MDGDQLRYKKVMLVAHYAGVKRWYNDGVFFLWVNGQALKFNEKDNATYAVMSLLHDVEAVCVECVYVDNWGIVKYLGQSAHISEDAIVSIDLMNKKVTVTGHDLSGSRLAVLCRMRSPLTYGELRRTVLSVSGSCEQLGGFNAKSAPEAVKLPNSSFLYAVPACQCVEKCDDHQMYKFISSTTHTDPEAYLADEEGVMWEGPSFVNREMPEMGDPNEEGEEKDVFPVLLGTWGSADNMLMDVPVTKVHSTDKYRSRIKPLNYGYLKAKIASNLLKTTAAFRDNMAKIKPECPDKSKGDEPSCPEDNQKDDLICPYDSKKDDLFCPDDSKKDDLICPDDSKDDLFCPDDSKKDDLICPDDSKKDDLICPDDSKKDDLTCPDNSKKEKPFRPASSMKTKIFNRFRKNPQGDLALGKKPCKNKAKMVTDVVGMIYKVIFNVPPHLH